jgi:hypothetical protein
LRIASAISLSETQSANEVQAVEMAKSCIDGLAAIVEALMTGRGKLAVLLLVTDIILNNVVTLHSHDSLLYENLNLNEDTGGKIIHLTFNGSVVICLQTEA